MKSHLEFTLGQPYGKVLSSTGNSLAEIIKNINTMHGHIKTAYFAEVYTASVIENKNRKWQLNVYEIS